MPLSRWTGFRANPRSPARNSGYTPSQRKSSEYRLVAEREGFEPSVPRKGHNGFRDRPDRPLRHLSVKAGPGIYHGRRRNIKRTEARIRHPGSAPAQCYALGAAADGGF